MLTACNLFLNETNNGLIEMEYSNTERTPLSYTSSYRKGSGQETINSKHTVNIIIQQLNERHKIRPENQKPLKS